MKPYIYFDHYTDPLTELLEFRVVTFTAATDAQAWELSNTPGQLAPMGMIRTVHSLSFDPTAGTPTLGPAIAAPVASGTTTTTTPITTTTPVTVTPVAETTQVIASGS